MDTQDRHDIEVRTRYLAAINDKFTADLEHLGVQVKIAHYTGDSSFPTEFTLRYANVVGSGPTFDMALMEFIEKLLKSVPVEKLL